MCMLTDSLFMSSHSNNNHSRSIVTLSSFVSCSNKGKGNAAPPPSKGKGKGYDPRKNPNFYTWQTGKGTNPTLAPVASPVASKGRPLNNWVFV